LPHDVAGNYNTPTTDQYAAASIARLWRVRHAWCLSFAVSDLNTWADPHLSSETGQDDLGRSNAARPRFRAEKNIAEYVQVAVGDKSNALAGSQLQLWRQKLAQTHFSTDVPTFRSLLENTGASVR
jgi:hypothetical protein